MFDAANAVLINEAGRAELFTATNLLTTSVAGDCIFALGMDTGDGNTTTFTAGSGYSLLQTNYSPGSGEPYADEWTGATGMSQGNQSPSITANPTGALSNGMLLQAVALKPAAASQFTITVTQGANGNNLPRGTTNVGSGGSSDILDHSCSWI